MEHTPSAALCPALWPKGQASLQGGLVVEFHSLGKEGYVPLAAGLPDSFLFQGKDEFFAFSLPSDEIFVQRPLPSSSQPQVIASGHSWSSGSELPKRVLSPFLNILFPPILLLSFPVSLPPHSP